MDANQFGKVLVNALEQNTKSNLLLANEIKQLNIHMADIKAKMPGTVGMGAAHALGAALKNILPKQ